MRNAIALLISLVVLAPGGASAQATCVDGTGAMCLDVVRAARADGVIDDVFETRDHHFAPELTFGTLLPFGGPTYCLGAVTDHTSIGGSVCCTSGDGVCLPSGAAAEYFVDLDWFWVAGVRTLPDGTTYVNDGDPGNYEPTRGFIFDLGAEANRVVVFPITDHGPLPCEAFEYTVWLSNDPHATVIAAPTAPDPRQWNEARLIRVFTQGWTRNPGATGADRSRTDLSTYLRDLSTGDALGDGLTTVWGLPCGLSFRYVSIQAGNDGNPGAVCTYHSSENEIDAIAGLNEDDTAICVDADGDGHRAASCGGSDCDDTDPMVHPGAFEPCNATRDFDCAPHVDCPMGTQCDTASGLCSTACFEGACGAGSTCTSGLCTDAACAALTVPCAAGTVCRAGACVAPCDGVTCPHGRLCISGACIDPCQGVVCPTMQVCVADQPGALTLCGPACTCTDLGTTSLCTGGSVCDARTGSTTAGRCVDPGCETLTCAAGQLCTSGACVDACAGVTCPLGQLCAVGECVVDRCASVRCATGLVCMDGACVDACTGVTCGAGMRCRAGTCETDPCSGIDCTGIGVCVDGLCVAADGGNTAMDASVHDAGQVRAPPSNAGCGCRVEANRASSVLTVLACLGIALATRRRRRRA